MILFDFDAPSVKSFNRKRSYIGMRIFIRIFYYPGNGHPDSKFSVLSIPSRAFAITNAARQTQSDPY